MFGLDFKAFLDIVQFFAFMSGGVWFLSNLSAQTTSLSKERALDNEANSRKFEQIEEQLEKLVTATVQLARQEERLIAMDNRLNELSHRIECIKNKSYTLAMEEAKITKRRRAT